MLFISSTNLELTTTQERKDLYQSASCISFIEFGEMPSFCKDMIKDYVIGRKRLSVVKKQMIEALTQKRRDSMPILDNVLNIYNMKTLKSALSAIVTVNMMMFGDKYIYSYNYADYKEVHKQLFKDVFPWAGIERDFSVEKKYEALGGRKISFLEFDEIEPQIRLVLEKLEDISNYTNIDIAIKQTLDKLYMDWTEMSEHVKAEMMADIIGSLLYIHPFLEGNITLSLYFVSRFGEKHDIFIDGKTLKEIQKDFIEKDRRYDLRVIILLASLNSYINFKDISILSDILNLAISEGNKKQQRILSMDSRRHIDDLIKAAKEKLKEYEDEDEDKADEEDEEY